MPRRSIEKNPFEYIIFDGQECVRFQTVGKYKYDVIVDKKAWDEYLSKHNWTVTMQGKRPSVKTSINNQTTFIWRMIIEHEKGELDCWGTTIDHINHNPLDNRLTNFEVYNSAILNSSNISSKFEDEDRQYIHTVTGGYRIHYSLAGKPYYIGFFGAKKYGSYEKALEAAKEYRDKYVIPEREVLINEMIRKTRNIEFERGLRDKIAAGETDEIIAVLRKYGIVQ